MINDNTVDKYTVMSTLKRLSSYYADRARISLKHARDATSAGATFQQTLSSLQWEAKYDAVHRVAENLDVVIDPNRESKGAVYTTDNREMFIVQFLKEALEAEGAMHKQYFLCKLAEAMGLKEIVDVVDDRGKAP